MRADALPLCETAAGCPIEDLAADPVLEELCTRFVKLRGLFEMSKSEVIYQQMMDDFGLSSDLDLHFELEGIYLQWMNKQKENSMNGTKRPTRKR